jgi:hypothetical protein
MIHTFGDSHATVGWCRIPGVEHHTSGPVTCHRIGKYGLSGINITGRVVGGDFAVFSFGEIDCRCHIGRYAECDAGAEIERLVGLYFNTLAENAALNPGVVIGVQTVTPAVRKEEQVDAPDYPFIGTNDERRRFVSLFNDGYRKFCKALGMVCVDIHDQYADSEGFLNPKYSDGTVHIDDPVFIIEFLKGNKCTNWTT